MVDRHEGEEGEGVGGTVKGYQEGDFYGDEIILYLDCSSSKTNLHLIKWHGTIHIHGTNVNFWVLILHCSYVRHNL